MIPIYGVDLSDARALCYRSDCHQGKLSSVHKLLYVTCNLPAGYSSFVLEYTCPCFFFSGSAYRIIYSFTLSDVPLGLLSPDAT